MTKKEKRLFKSSVFPAVAFAVFLWLIRAFEVGLDADLSGLGIYPRTLSGTLGIVTAPLVHGDSTGNQWSHLFNNTISIVPLIAMIMYFHRSIAHKVFLSLWLFTGIWVWCFARPSFHIGASGLAYAMASFMMFIGIFRKNPQEMALSGIVILMHSGLLYGLLPISPTVSWESHLMGFIAGIVIAWYYRKHNVPVQKRDWLESPIDDKPYNISYEYEDRYDQSSQVNFQYHYKEKEEDREE